MPFVRLVPFNVNVLNMPSLITRSAYGVERLKETDDLCVGIGLLQLPRDEGWLRGDWT
jgi:hypothetical protein